MKNIFTFILVLIIASCASSVKTIETPVVMNEKHTEYISNETKDTVSLKDSVYIIDSIYIKERGDTVYYYKTNIQYKYKTQYKYLAKTDTLLIRDSIPYPIKTIEYKEVVTNELTWLQKTLMYIGVAVVILLLGIVIYKCIKLYLKK